MVATVSVKPETLEIEAVTGPAHEIRERLKHAGDEQVVAIKLRRGSKGAAMIKSSPD